MHFQSLILPLFAILPSLALAAQCVVGGPAAEVKEAEECCLSRGGTWYQYYPVQAICVVGDSREYSYVDCLKAIDGYDVTLDAPPCIPGYGSSLTLSGTPTATVTPQVTITARSYPIQRV